MLKISNHLKLPADVVTTATAILGIRGSGKTNTGVVAAEELLQMGYQVIIIDPLDVWWGLKSSADGKKPGYSVTVIGGSHGDVPLGEGDGKILADFLVDNPVPAILSLRHLTKSASRRFLESFAEHFYHRKGEAGKNTPVLLIVDEASLFIPQHVTGDIARLVGSIQSWVRQGRVAGIGCMLIDQRPATVNKDVLSQVELLICHRLIASHDRKALREWIDAHSTEDQQTEFTRTVATLKQGEAWFWSPEWLGLFKRVQVNTRRTFDSSATPKSGQQVKAPVKLANVDLDRLREQLAVTIEKSKADDPKALRLKIADFEKQLKAKQAVPTIDRQALDQACEQARAAIIRQVQPLVKAVEEFQKSFSALWVSISEGLSKHSVTAPASRDTKSRAISHPLPNQLARLTVKATGENSLGKAERLILRALYWLRDETADKTKVAFYSGYSAGSGGFNNALGRLRSLGLVEGWQITQDGITEADKSNDRPHGSELREWLRPKLGKAENSLLDALVEAHPDRLSKDDLSNATGYASGSGGFNNALGRLRSIEAAIGYERDGGIKASDVFFG